MSFVAIVTAVWAIAAATAAAQGAEDTPALPPEGPRAIDTPTASPTGAIAAAAAAKVQTAKIVKNRRKPAPRNATRAETMLLTETSIQQLDASKLGRHKLSNLSDVALRAIAPTVIAQLRPTRVCEMKPIQFGRLTDDQIAALTPDQVKCLAADKFAQLHPDAIGRLSTQAVRYINVTVLKAISRYQLQGLKKEQRDALTPEQHQILEGRSKVQRQDDAIQPGIRLLGDAYSQLTGAGEEGGGAQGAFGGGAELEWRRARVTALVRKGTQPSVLTDEIAFGRSLLNPQTESFLFGLEGYHWPEYFTTPARDWAAGYQLRAYTATTNWQLTLAPELADDPGTPMVDGRSASVVSSDAVTVAVSAAINVRHVAAADSNYVDVGLFFGPTLRFVSLDGSADRAIATQRALDDRVASSGFLRQAINRDAPRFYGFEGGASLRINSVVITGTVMYIWGETAGLSGLNFIPALSLRAGAKVVEFYDR